MSRLMVIQAAKVYPIFYVYAKNALEAKQLVDNGGELSPHASYPLEVNSV